MADIYDKKKRSEVMAKVRSKHTKPELIVRSLLHGLGYRFTVNGPKNTKLPGKPDIVLPKMEVVIFVHGCFWHQHKHCKKAALPKSRKNFWERKLNANVARDRRNQNLLKKMGWNVVIVWECQTKDRDELRRQLLHWLNEYS